LQIRAYRVAPASFLSPFVYLQICTATAMGWLCFGQHPDGVTAIGMVFVIGGGVLTGWLEYRARRALADARGV
jgi:drug/metabolite transporter (DMT)-like permease